MASRGNTESVTICHGFYHFYGHVKHLLLSVTHVVANLPRFLPLSFFTSLFGINAREWSGTQENLPLAEMLEIAGRMPSNHGWVAGC